MIKIVGFLIEFEAIRVEGRGVGGLAQCSEGGRRLRDPMDSWADRVIVRSGRLSPLRPRGADWLLRR
jgi:hypothetical protein